MSERPGEERERRVFFSWQSDTPRKSNRTLIEAALEVAAKNAGAEWSPSDRPTMKVQTAASDVVGARQIADVIFERIRSADAFVADVSLVVRRGKRLMPNPNVLVETGYALHALSDARIVLVANTALGPIEELPFDLRGRLALTYEMKSTDAPAAARTHLSKEMTAILAKVLSLPRTTQDVRVDVGVFDIIDALDLKSRESVYVTTVRNFSDFPLRLVSIAYEYDGQHGGFTYPPHAPMLAVPIPARDSRSFHIPIAAMTHDSRTVVRVVATDSLGRAFASIPGAVQSSLASRNGRTTTS